MASRRLLVTALFLLLGCGTDPAPQGALSLTVSTTAIDANGVNFAVIQVTGTSIGRVSIRSNRGSFEGMGNLIFFNKTPFSTMLVSCDSRTSSSCAGMATIDVSDESLAGAGGQVMFRQVP